MRYTIEELILIFNKHGKEAKKDNESLIKQFKENFPNAPIPDGYKNDFSLPEALESICLEIQILKEFMVDKLAE